jgi:hypothetical protein
MPLSVSIYALKYKEEAGLSLTMSPELTPWTCIENGIPTLPSLGEIEPVYPRALPRVIQRVEEMLACYAPEQKTMLEYLSWFRLRLAPLTGLLIWCKS